MSGWNSSNCLSKWGRRRTSDARSIPHFQSTAAKSVKSAKGDSIGLAPPGASVSWCVQLTIPPWQDTIPLNPFSHKDPVMPVFAWIPFYDSGWVVYSMHSHLGQRTRILPFVDGHAPFSGHERVSWGDIVAGDTLLLAAHGRKWSTDNVAWVKEDGTITQWTAQSFAQAIYDRLGGNSGLELDYQLLACFGANNITPLAQSFGSKLAKEMSLRNMRGTLSAYKGATGMGALRGSQIGSSRVTCALSIMLNMGKMTKGRATALSAKVWNL